jgi:hypothetical protein
MEEPRFPLEILLMFADHLIEDCRELHYGGFNSFLQVNLALYDRLNSTLWQLEL